MQISLINIHKAGPFASHSSAVGRGSNSLSHDFAERAMQDPGRYVYLKHGLKLKPLSSRFLFAKGQSSYFLELASYSRMAKREYANAVLAAIRNRKPCRKTS